MLICSDMEFRILGTFRADCGWTDGGQRSERGTGTEFKRGSDDPTSIGIVEKSPSAIASGTERSTTKQVSTQRIFTSEETDTKTFNPYIMYRSLRRDRSDRTSSVGFDTDDTDSQMSYSNTSSPLQVKYIFFESVKKNEIPTTTSVSSIII